ncbi:MAG: peptidylprolyl isomerase [Edaphobacter sp.]
MHWIRLNPGWWLRGAGALLAAAALAQGATLLAQQPVAPSALPGAGQGTTLDRIVAVVNGDLILESDIDEEQRFESIQPYRTANGDSSSRERTVRRLIDRTLILQQAEMEPETAISDKELDAQLMTVRKDIPACKQYHCETDAGWQKYVNDHGFTVAEFRERWRQRMELLRFIEVRFRNGIRIPDDDIKAYYEKTMLPEYAKRGVAPPKLETISPRIEEVLLQQQVGNLLRDWLTSLRAQGRVRIMKPGEVAP